MISVNKVRDITAGLVDKAEPVGVLCGICAAKHEERLEAHWMRIVLSKEKAMPMNSSAAFACDPRVGNNRVSYNRGTHVPRVQTHGSVERRGQEANVLHTCYIYCEKRNENLTLLRIYIAVTLSSCRVSFFFSFFFFNVRIFRRNLYLEEP